MKIIQRTPTLPRGKSTNSAAQVATREAIRNAYENGTEKEVKVIPATRDLIPVDPNKKKRVAAYCRVSTDEDSQGMSYELQVQNYKQMINDRPDWEFAGIYADEGISGTSTLHRENFLRMIEDCKMGKIDLIITKQVNRFARNLLDSLQFTQLLGKLEPPVGVFFETEGLNSLDDSARMVLAVLSLIAENESIQKSRSIRWAYQRRWKKGVGIRPSWALYGYRCDEQGNWIIVDGEADVIRAIYRLYLDGYSSSHIAEFLTQSNIPTVMGREQWTSGSVLGILRNEKYCGDVLCQKTVTADFYTHKVVKNKGHETQYFIEGHHEAIIPKDEWQMVQQIRQERRYRRVGSKMRKPTFIKRGELSGFMINDFDWDEEFANHYLERVIYDDDSETSAIETAENK